MYKELSTKRDMPSATTIDQELAWLERAAAPQLLVWTMVWIALALLVEEVGCRWFALFVTVAWFAFKLPVACFGLGLALGFLVDAVLA